MQRDKTQHWHTPCEPLQVLQLRRARPEIAGWINILWDETVWSILPEFRNLTQTGSYCEQVNTGSCAAGFAMVTEGDGIFSLKEKHQNMSLIQILTVVSETLGSSERSAGCGQVLATFPSGAMSSKWRLAELGMEVFISHLQILSIGLFPDGWFFGKKNSLVRAWNPTTVLNFCIFYSLQRRLAINFVRPDALTQHLPTSRADLPWCL